MSEIVKAGLRQMGHAGLLRLKSHLIGGGEVLLDGSIIKFQDGKPIY